MSDKRQQFRQNTDASRVSSTSDVRMEQRQRMFARSPALQKSHNGSLERVDEEPSTMADSSTDYKHKAGQMFHSNHGTEHHFAHDGPFKKPAQQGYFRFPITPPYYDNRYSCGNPMCRESHYCYEHQMNPYNSSIPMPPSPFMHDCHANFLRQTCQTSPLFMNPNHMKRSENDFPRPKLEWPVGYRPPNTDPLTPSTPAQYLASLSSKDNNSIPPSTATSLRSSNLEPFMLPSPRQSARLARKRAISSSPLSIDSIDINSLIRTSPDSLIAYINAPRLSSAGSYGHLSANGISPSPKPPRSSSMRSTLFGCWQTTPTGPRAMPQFSDIKPAEVTAQPIKQEKTTEKEIKKESQEESMNVDSNHDENKLSSINSPAETDKRESEAENEETTEKDENNNEFLCLWKDCNILFQSQDELVKHVNTDHIKKERRDFTCHWVGCQREQKPFKAQYMLVVHMRRHTGEKPNKCTFPGCNKAYSRLENLKTHERSHTGERPYVCEFENCSKAFTNASDRAKHQNRTHSSVKPYVCTVAGCTKRYTDPSSLRKHKKTCHPEHFAGAKKPKVDEAKSKPNENAKNSAATKPAAKGSQGKQNPGSNDGKQNGDPSSPGARDQRESGQGKNISNIQQIDFSPQSFTSSSSCVDSPHSANVVCDEPDESSLSPQAQSKSVTNQNKNNSGSPRSPQEAMPYSFPDRHDLSGPVQEGGGELMVENRAVPNQLSLPTINKQNEVGKWIADVTQRMSHVGNVRYPNEMKENIPADYSSRRSSESGVSSYISSRRSSEMSTLTRQPHGAVPPLVEETPEDMYPPNKQASDAHLIQQQQLPQIKQWNNNPRRNEYFDDMTRPSPVPDVLHNDQRRSSSGYGSHHNLAVIRSPVFHKVPIQKPPEPPPNRRMSDSIICEADSSNRYLPLRNNNIGPRRSSEPATHYHSNGPNEFYQPQYPQGRPLPDFPQRQPSMFNKPRPPPRPQPLERGQKLSHYPYSIDAPNQDYLYPPHPPNHPQGNNNPPQQNKGLWQYEQHINQQLLQVRDQQQQNNFMPGQVYPNDMPAMNNQNPMNNRQAMNGQVQPVEGSYESMLNGISNLNTNEIVDQSVLHNGPSNMVVNDMNTLLNSLIEEDRYLEKTQEHSNMTSALSHIF